MNTIFFQKFYPLIKKKRDLFILSFILIITILITTNHNVKKEQVTYNQKNLINNIFFKKTLNTIFSNLDQKFKKIKHKIKSGENFEQILSSYSVDDNQIKELKKILSKKVDLNKLNTDLTFEFIIDQSTDKVVKFNFPLSKTKRIDLVKSSIDNKFEQQLVVTKLIKKIIYAEDVIEQSLYKAATTNKVPSHIIIDFASIYGFKVDFQRDIKKKDEFQILFEAFLNEKNQII